MTITLAQLRVVRRARGAGLPPGEAAAPVPQEGSSADGAPSPAAPSGWCRLDGPRVPPPVVAPWRRSEGPWVHPREAAKHARYERERREGR